MIIGICGNQGAGKSTVCEVAINLQRSAGRPFVRMGHSDPLYQMLIAMGVPEDIVWNKARWNDPLEVLCGKTVRYACDTLGNDWGRNMIGSTVWGRMAIAKAQEWEKRSYIPVIDNVRYWTEQMQIRAVGGVLIAFNRVGLLVDTSKPSEREIKEIQEQRCKHSFLNTGDDLEHNAREFRKLLDAIAEAT